MVPNRHIDENKQILPQDRYSNDYLTRIKHTGVIISVSRTATTSLQQAQAIDLIQSNQLS